MKLLMIVLMRLMVLPVHAQTLIEVFSDRPVSVANIPGATVTVYDLSRAVSLESELPALPSDPVLAKQKAKDWIQSEAGQAHLSRVKSAYRGHEQMIVYGVQKIPAVVFEKGKYVVYGTLDVALAVRDFDDYMKHLQQKKTNQETSDE